MKKFAYIVMGPHYNPEEHQLVFETKGGVTAFFTVRNYEQAKEKVLSCAEDGFGVIELCGAFGEEKAKELILLTENKVGIAFVIHLPEQNALFDAFFSRKG